MPAYIHILDYTKVILDIEFQGEAHMISLKPWWNQGIFTEKIGWILAIKFMNLNRNILCVCIYIVLFSGDPKPQYHLVLTLR